MSKEKEVKKFMEKFVKHGMGCGEQIGDILQKKYPESLVFPLYRSAVAMEYDKKERIIRLHCAGDPHVWGKDLIKENIEEDTYVISGNRFGPFLYQIFFEEKTNFVKCPKCGYEFDSKDYTPKPEKEKTE